MTSTDLPGDVLNAFLAWHTDAMKRGLFSDDMAISEYTRQKEAFLAGWNAARRPPKVIEPGKHALDDPGSPLAWAQEIQRNAQKSHIPHPDGVMERFRARHNVPVAYTPPPDRPGEPMADFVPTSIVEPVLGPPLREVLDRVHTRLRDVMPPGVPLYPPGTGLYTTDPHHYDPARRETRHDLPALPDTRAMRYVETVWDGNSDGAA